MNTCILDTSCLTQAFRVYYPFDIAPSFWRFIKEGITSRKIIIIDKVYAEICRGNDELKTWIDTEIATTDIFHCDSGTLTHYASIMQWGNGHLQYGYNAKLDFSEFENADPFVVATAMALTGTVVSQEIGETKELVKTNLQSFFTLYPTNEQKGVPENVKYHQIDLDINKIIASIKFPLLIKLASHFSLKVNFYDLTWNDFTDKELLVEFEKKKILSTNDIVEIIEMKDAIEVKQ